LRVYASPPKERFDPCRIPPPKSRIPPLVFFFFSWICVYRLPLIEGCAWFLLRRCSPIFSGRVPVNMTSHTTSLICKTPIPIPIFSPTQKTTKKNPNRNPRRLLQASLFGNFSRNSAHLFNAVKASPRRGFIPAQANFLNICLFLTFRKHDGKLWNRAFYLFSSRYRRVFGREGFFPDDAHFFCTSPP